MKGDYADEELIKIISNVKSSLFEQIKSVHGEPENDKEKIENVCKAFENVCKAHCLNEFKDALKKYTDDELVKLINKYWDEFTNILSNDHSLLQVVGEHAIQVYEEANRNTKPVKKESLESMSESILRLAGWLAAFSKESLHSKISSDMIEEFTLNKTTTKGDSVLHIACYHGDKNVKNLLRSMQKNKRRQMMMSRNKFGLTPLHKACMAGQAECVRALLTSVNNEIKKKLVLQTDIINDSSNGPVGKTALHLACSMGHDSCVSALLERIPEDTKPKLITVKNKDGESALHSACLLKNVKSVKALLENIPKNSLNDVLLEQDKKGRDVIALSDWKCTEAIMSAVHSQTDYTTQEIKLISILSRKNKFRRPLIGLQDHLADNIDMLDNCKKNVRCDKTLSECFPDFCLPPVKESFCKIAKNHPLRILSSTKNIALIKHPYVQAYIDTCWKRFARYILGINVLHYILFFALLTCYVSSHQFIENLTNSTSFEEQNGLDTNHTHTKMKVIPAFDVVTHFIFRYSLNLNYTEFSRYLTAIFAVVGIIYEFWQMNAKRRYYFVPDVHSGDWICIENYVDLTLFLGAIAITIVPLGMEYSTWFHGIGCVLILVGVLRGSWLLIHVPLVGGQFLMLLKVVQKVLIFSPVIFSFVATFSVLFHNLLATQKVFSDYGTSLTKVLVMMSIGEVDFEQLFVTDENQHGFETLANVLMVAFLVLMTVSMMNLLIGVAVGDVKEMSRHRALYMSKLDLILQYAYMFPSINDYVHNKTFEQLNNLYDNDDIDSEEFALEMYFERFEEEYRKYRRSVSDPAKVKNAFYIDKTDILTKSIGEIIAENEALKAEIAELKRMKDYKVSLTKSIE